MINGTKTWTPKRTQAKIEGFWNVSLKKNSRGHATRQKAECGHNEDSVYRQRYQWTPANPMANIFLSCVSYDSWKISTYCIVWTTEGSRTRGRPRKKWLDNIREDFPAMNLTLVEATRVAEDRRFWRTSIRDLGCQREDSVIVAKALIREVSNSNGMKYSDKLFSVILCISCITLGKRI